MRYSLDSTLPINAFSPRGKSPFSRGMTLEGGGSMNPVRAVTEGLGSVADIGTKAVKGVVQPVYNATLKNIPGVDNALVNLDKSVAKAIPGGWGTVASVASSFIPGAQLAAMGMTQTGLATGLGALSGSGVMRGNHQFNLQGAILGGAMAYGASQLSTAFQEAGKGAAETASKTGSDIVAEAAKSSVTPSTDAIANLNASQGWTGPSATNLGSSIPQSAINSANAATQAGANAASSINPATGLDFSATGSGLTGNAVPPPTVMDKFMTGDVSGGLSQIGSNISEGATSAANTFKSGIDTLTSPETYSNLGSKLSETASGTFDNMGKAYTGAGNLISGTASLPAGTLTTAGIPLVIGASGLMALEEQQKYLEQQAASGAISNAEYNAAKAKIDAQVAAARATVSANPLQTSADTSNLEEGPTLYGKKSTGFETLYDKNPSGGSTLYEQAPVTVARGGMINRYAMGGDVQANTQDDQTNQPSNTPLTNISNQAYGITYGMNNFDNASTATNTQAQAQPAQPAVQNQGTGSFPQLYYGDSGLGNLGQSGGNSNALPLEGQYGIVKMAAGGMAPRFLSGGGDGMSDSIPANINGTQEARLADGEFVVPADVVSHIGNGSSKAGAKQLYSMMDRVRQARVGTKKQGKQINPRKYLAA